MRSGSPAPDERLQFRGVECWPPSMPADCALTWKDTVIGALEKVAPL